jgi:hypothetical protein
MEPQQQQAGHVTEQDPLAEQAPEAPSRRLPGKPLWWAIGGIVAVGGVVITLILTLAGGGRDLTVRFALIDFEDGVSCAGGTGGYNDVGPGMAVVVRDNDGRVIGTSALDPGGEAIENYACEWTAVVEDVPTGEDYYSISVGRRGEQVYTGDQLEERDWEINLTLGG